MDDYCNFCGVENKRFLMTTYDNKSICGKCADELGLCEICGSILKADAVPDNQPHYEEDCFK